MRIDSEYVEEFRKLAQNYLDQYGYKLSDVESGADAWTIAHRAGITEICYGNTAKDLPGIIGCVDAHIKTALSRIFPNAVFHDKYGY